jgi:hypothetical protein
MSPGLPVSATAPFDQEGGSPGIDQIERRDLTDTQLVIVIRLAVALFGYGSHDSLNQLLGEELKANNNTAVHQHASARLVLDSRKYVLDFVVPLLFPVSDTFAVSSPCD